MNLKQGGKIEKLPIEIEKIIQTFVNKINKLLGKRIKKIILYGSYARGDYKKNSDIDIMILTDLNDNELVQYRDKVFEMAYDIEFNNDFKVTLSPLLKNINKYNERINVVPFYSNIQKEGIIING